MHVNFLVLKSSNRSQKNMKSNNTINMIPIVEGIDDSSRSDISSQLVKLIQP